MLVMMLLEDLAVVLVVVEVVEVGMVMRMLMVVGVQLERRGRVGRLQINAVTV